jgi:glycosyltransferase involved in cell wall biosynthesis
MWLPALGASRSICMKLSVAMITYNHERFITQAVESVLAQTVNFDYQLVIGEDCSTDGTLATVLDFQRRYPNRIVVHSRKKNVGAMRNFAETIEACRGQYLALLEGDDYWTCTDKLQKQVDFLDAHPDWAVCCSRAEVRNEEEVHSGKVRASTGTIFPSRPDAIRPDGQDVGGLLPATPRAAGTYTLGDLLQENFIPTCSVVYRWNGLPRLPSWFFQSSLGDLPLHAIVTGKRKIELLDDCMAVYRVHTGGIWSSRNRNSQILENARMLEALGRHLDGRYNKILGPIVARSYLEMAIVSRQQGKRIGTGRHLISCIRNGGLRLPVSLRTFAGLAGYTLIGSGYKIFSREGRV